MLLNIPTIFFQEMFFCYLTKSVIYIYLTFRRKPVSVLVNLPDSPTRVDQLIGDSSRDTNCKQIL